MSAAILIIEDEATLARNLATYLIRHGYDTTLASTAEEGLAQIDTVRPEIVLLDYALPGMTGIAALKRIKALDPRIQVIMMTGHGSEVIAVEAMKSGAQDYLIKPVALSEVRLLVERLLGQEKLEEELNYHRRRIAAEGALDHLIGRSAAIEALKASVIRLLRAERELVEGEPPAVLITGETGTGKELVARALHFDGARRDNPFVEINCSTIPAQLLEAELFGYERGAFTDARQRKLGLIEAAAKGTLFLDEIGDVALPLQVKLLKLLEDKTVRRLGSVREQRADVRIVAATNRDLDEAVRNGEFRTDLLFRLNTVHLRIPPLRERGDDVMLLAEHFLDVHRRRYRKGELRFDAGAREAMAAYPWPGNVRELRSIVEQAVIMSTSDTIGATHLRLPQRAEIATPALPMNDDGKVEGELNLLDAERELLERALAQAGGNVTRAARLLGITRDTLRYRMEKFKL